MNVTRLSNYPAQYKHHSYNPSFKNAAWLSSLFMAMNMHEIIGVSIVDLTSMVIPRSAIDFTRNKEAGIETAIRESSSTATHGAIGLAGLGAAALLALGLKRKNYNVDFKKITANDATINGMAQVFKQVVDETPVSASKEEISRRFLDRIFADVQGLAGNAENGDKKLWYALTNKKQVFDKDTIKVKDKIIETLLKHQKDNSSYKINPKTLNQLEALMNIDIPSTQLLKVKLGKDTIDTVGSHFLSDAHSLTKAFTQDKILDSFRKAKDSASVEFIKDLEKLGIRKTILGLAAICAVALSMQTINRRLTKKRTGLDSFVGDPDYEKKLKSQNDKKPVNMPKDTPKHKEKDSMFVPLKILSMLGMGFFIFKTLNTKFSQLASTLQFKGNLPTINQIKVVYGSTILGRLFASSDKNELRESAFRDFLGYTNFLVLGSLITKWFVNKKDKSLINYDPAVNGKGLLNWLKNSTIKTHQEVINSTLKNNVITENGTLPLKELYKNNWIQNGGTIAEKLGILNKAKLIGILYSCIALGIIVPLINKYMTQAKKKKENAQINPEQQVSQAPKSESVKPKPLTESDFKKTELSNKTKKIISDFFERTK